MQACYVLRPDNTLEEPSLIPPYRWANVKEPFVSQANSMRKRHRFNTRMTRIVLLISFLFFFGRFVYSSIGAWQHHQDKKEAQQSTLSVNTPGQR
ncbi:membrane protein [Salmonella enterica subsp. arizonae]|uniref:Membrane protein n=2 Tax=Salmonella enterica TaxID=28901 RepID=A0A3S5DFY4_SALER|nr:membrane protein [Salmonella enterica subsp. arizonae]